MLHTERKYADNRGFRYLNKPLCNIPNLSVLTAIFQVNLGQLVLLKLKMVVVPTGAMLCKSSPTNQLFTGRMPFLLPNQQR